MSELKEKELEEIAADIYHCILSASKQIDNSISKATNFHIRISKPLVKILLELLESDKFEPNWFTIMCKEYGEDEDWIGIENYEEIEDEEYQTFEIWIDPRIEGYMDFKNMYKYN